MRQVSAMLTATVAAGLLLTACADAPSAPRQAEPSQPAISASAAATSASAAATHAIRLTCFAGPCTGSGYVNVTPNSRPVPGANEGFGFAVEGQFNVHGAPRNTTYLVQRRVDLLVNGICTGLAFVTFPIPQAPGPLVTLTTSPAGAGAAHFDLQLPGFADGSQFDVMFRLIESAPNAGGTELRTECVTVTVK